MKSFTFTRAPTWLQITSELGAEQPLVVRAALVRLKVAEADVAQLGQIDDFGDRLANFRMHAAQPGVVEQRFSVFHQEMVELQVGGRHKDRDAIDVRRNFGGDGHFA
jgi:hypothetical protein